MLETARYTPTRGGLQRRGEILLYDIQVAHLSSEDADVCEHRTTSSWPSAMLSTIINVTFGWSRLAYRALRGSRADGGGGGGGGGDRFEFSFSTPSRSVSFR